VIPLSDAFGIGDLQCMQIIRGAGAPADPGAKDDYTLLYEAVGTAPLYPLTKAR